jgi:hypothetical protein
MATTSVVTQKRATDESNALVKRRSRRSQTAATEHRVQQGDNAQHRSGGWLQLIGLITLGRAMSEMVR